MKKLRNQMAEAANDSPDEEDDIEQEIMQERFSDDGEPIASPKFERIRTGRSARSLKQIDEPSGPFDIDRVHTRDSFKRVSSRKSTKSLKSGKSGA